MAQAKHLWQELKKICRSWSSFLNFIKRYLAIIGLLYTFCCIINLFFSTNIINKSGLSSTWITIILLLIFLIFFLTQCYIKKVIIPLNETKYPCTIQIKNIFTSEDANIIISCNRNFQTSIEKGEIDRESVFGQFIEKHFNGRVKELNEKILQSLTHDHYTKDKKGRYPIGSVAKIKIENKNYYLLATTTISKSGKSYCNETMLNRALFHLWNYMQKSGEYKHTSIHLVGYGRGRLALNQTATIYTIIKTFKKASKQNNFLQELTICIHNEQDTDLNKIKQSMISIL